MGINLSVDKRDRDLQQPELSKKRSLKSCAAIKYNEPVVKNLPLKRLVIDDLSDVSNEAVKEEVISVSLFNKMEVSFV